MDLELTIEDLDDKSRNIESKKNIKMKTLSMKGNFKDPSEGEGCIARKINKAKRLFYRS